MIEHYPDTFLLSKLVYDIMNSVTLNPNFFLLRKEEECVFLVTFNNKTEQ